MGEWMDCDFTSFSTVFQSYQDDERLITKAVCNGTPFMLEISPIALVGSFRSNGPLRQYFSLYWAVSQSEEERGEKI